MGLVQCGGNGSLQRFSHGFLEHIFESGLFSKLFISPKSDKSQFFSHYPLRELQERCHFCHNTFRDSGQKGRLCEPGPRKIIALLFGKELSQTTSKLRRSCFLTIETHEQN